MSTDDVASSDTGDTTAALLGSTSAGSQVALVLYGIFLAVHLHYLSSDLYERLALRVKVTLHVVATLLTAYTVLIFVDSTHWTTTSHRSPSEIRDGWPVDAILPLLAGLAQVPVQAILTLRAAVLISRKPARNAFIGFLAVLILFSFAGALLSCVSALLYEHGEISFLSPLSFNYSVVIWLLTTAVTDVLICVTLGFTIRQRIGGFEAGSSFWKKTAVVGYSTAAYTAILAVAGAATAAFYQDSDSPYFLLDWAFWLPLPACHALSLYTTLSVRRSPEHYLTASQASLPSTISSVKRPLVAPVIVPVVTAAPDEEKPPSSTSSSRPPYPPHHTKATPRTSGIFDKIETWERRSSLDVGLTAPPGMRRSSSFDLRAVSKLRSPVEDQEVAPDEGRRRSSTDGGEQEQRRRDASVIDFGGRSG
ncbi:hypothetical protein JCM8547_007960 [Rhodosporidiobolus lusitaniae]